MKIRTIFLLIISLSIATPISKTESEWYEKLAFSGLLIGTSGTLNYLIEHFAINSKEYLEKVKFILEQEKKWGWDQHSVDIYMRKEKCKNNLLLFSSIFLTYICGKYLLKPALND